VTYLDGSSYCALDLPSSVELVSVGSDFVFFLAPPVALFFGKTVYSSSLAISVVTNKRTSEMNQDAVVYSYTRL
jgi:hypothetical protein